MNLVQTAQHETVTLDLSQPEVDGQKLTAEVTITNKVGHRFPSGVGFRRAFIEFVVMDNGSINQATGQPKIVWSSGRTNGEGFIVDR